MHQYTLSLDGESVGILSDTDLSPIFTKWKGIPYLNGVEVGQGSDQVFTVKYFNASSRPVLYTDDSVLVTVPIEQLQTGEVLLYAALPFLEVLHQRKRVVTIHAAAVESNGKAILLLGKAGAGKTSLTLSLCRNHKARLIGNDIVKVGLVDEAVIAFAGSKYFFLRQESIKRNIPDLLSLFPKSEKDPWTHKIHCLPDKLGIVVCTDPIPIKKSYQVHVDETMDKLYVTKANKIDTGLHLNENMSRYIRGTAIALFSEDSRCLGYVPSLDTPDFFNMRVGLSEVLVSTTEMVHLSGNLHDTCQYIAEDA